MVKRRPSRRAPSHTSAGRLANARAFLQSARDLLALAGEDDNGNPMMSAGVNAAIAYADALTIRLAGRTNAEDHAALVAALKSVLGDRASGEQMQRLARIIAMKDDVQYGHRASRIGEARKLIEQVERFATWVEGELSRLR